jgi:hypothetical protein
VSVVASEVAFLPLPAAVAAALAPALDADAA